jgi:ABC-2 type transport system permease protein
MSKISLIIKREYLTRVKKKSFIIMTFLTPVLLAGLMIIPAWLVSMKDDKEKILAVVDYTGLYEGQIQDTELLKFQFIPQNKETDMRQNFINSEYYAFMIITEDLMKNPNGIKMYSDATITMDVKEHVARSLNDYLKDEKLKSYNIEGFNEILAELDNINVNISTLKISEDGAETQSSSEVAMIISMFFGMFSYMFIFMYGVQVFNGIMEEKKSRIVEVLISSVKPFELMMGKIVGIACVAITQFVMWIVLTGGIYFVAMSFAAPSVDLSQLDAASIVSAEEMMNNTGIQLNNIFEIIKSFNPVMMLLLFVFYFISGYLLYASMYAIVGSAVDNETDAQQFMMPITIPIIIGFIIAFTTFQNPASQLVFWGSMIPFTAPFVMMARVSFGVPGWEIILSMTLMVLGFIFTTWFASKIYRTGILMYGKKVDYKEIWKWFKYSLK